jgi:uncharacterized phiE125 gp8 family phage protein
MDPVLVSTPLTRNQKLAVCPVPRVKMQARIVASDEHELLASYVVAAYDFLSGPNGWLGGVSLLEEEWLWTISSRLSRTVELPMRPFRGSAVSSFGYLQADGSYLAVDASLYSVSLGSAFTFPSLYRGTTFPWPYVGIYNDAAYQVQFKAGFTAVDEPQGVPEPIVLAISMLAAHWFNNRETVGAEGREPGKEIMYGLKSLAGRYRIGPDHS